MPPMYVLYFGCLANTSFSALRIDGKRAYEYARLGQELPKELASREVTVAKLNLVDWYDTHSFPAPKEEAPEEEKKLEESISKIYDGRIQEEGVGLACRVRMTVSSGFYVRSLCYDLGLKVGSGAYMAELIRTRQGQFKLEDAIPWEDFVEGGPWEDKLVKTLSVRIGADVPQGSSAAAGAVRNANARGDGAGVKNNDTR
jgi:tRNA U55 pseudouridine synthase TruB